MPTQFFQLNYYRPPFNDNDLSRPGKFRSRTKVRFFFLILVLLGGSFFSYLFWSYFLVTYNVTESSRIKDPSYFVEAGNLDEVVTSDPRWVLSEQAPVVTVPSIASFFKVTIPAINLADALVTTNVTSDKSEVYFPIIEKSLAHYQGSALPGQRGNVFIYGHSVLPQFFNPKDYLTIFSNLYKLKNDDSVYLKIGAQVVEYKVTGKKIIDPKDLKSANLETQNGQTLTLMTCYPPGLTTQRLLVYADQVK